MCVKPIRIKKKFHLYNHYGHRLRTDHILFGSESEKGSDGESSCLVVQDLQRIAGAWGSDRSQCFIKTDGGQELKQRNQ